MPQSLPIVGISGKAGSGKDAVAHHLVTKHGFTQIAWADTVKSMAADIFMFTEDQLWGPSDNRNEVDHRFSSSEVWQESRDRMGSCGKRWIGELLGAPEGSKKVFKVFLTLVTWFDDLQASYPELSPRVALQTLGTEWGRDKVRPSLWVDYTMVITRQLLSQDKHTVYIRTKGLQEVLENPGIKGVVITGIRFENELKAIPAAGGYLLKLVRPEPPRDVGILHHPSESEQDGFDSSMFNATVVNDGTLKDLYQDIDVILLTVT